jgi:hypothetical protein
MSVGTPAHYFGHYVYSEALAVLEAAPSTGPATTAAVGLASYSLSCWSQYCIGLGKQFFSVFHFPFTRSAAFRLIGSINPHTWMTVSRSSKIVYADMAMKNVS